MARLRIAIVVVFTALAALLQVFNDAWSDNWELGPFAQPQIEAPAASTTPLIDPDMVVIAEIDGRMAGYGMLSLNDLDWSRHLAELRVLVHPDYRETGLGRAMIREVFALAVNRGVEKVIARMTLDQTAARSLFQELGFRPEALHENEVKDRAGKLHDVLRMAVDVQALLARRDSYGLG